MSVRVFSLLDACLEHHFAQVIGRSEYTDRGG